MGFSLTRLLGWRTDALGRAFAYLKPYTRLVVGTYSAMVVIFLINLSIPQLIGQTVDRGITKGDLSLIGATTAGLLGITLIKGVLTYWQGRWSEIASQAVAYDLRNSIQLKLTQLSYSFHDKAEAGELLARAVQDVERIRFLTGRAALRILEALVLLVGYTGVLLWMNISLALLVIATLPILIYTALSFGRRFRPLSLKIQQEVAVLTTRLEQNLRGIQVVKAFAQEQAEIDRFDEENERWFQLSRQASRLEALNVPFLFLVANFGLVFIIWYGGSLVISGQLSMGELVAFTAYVGLVIDPVRRLGMIIPAVAIASAAAERVFEILDSVSEVQDAPNARILPPLKGDVRFDNAGFHYGKQTVLQNIDFEVKAGQVVALVGPTGSGKSSLIHLIPRFYDVTSGKVLVDGIDVRQVTIQSLRSQIGIVLQETMLFAATIRENIAFGAREASMEQIVAAAQAAQAHEFIMEMRQGYDTRVGERGVTLSGGQRQRIAIARLLITDPRVLLLDDATSSVDSETEYQILQAFERVMQGRTTFVIAHRLSTVRRADLTIVLEKGRIAALGKHADLLNTSPLYQDIYEQQLIPQTGENLPANSSKEVRP